MPYRVEWGADARDTLAEIWLAASDRAAVTRAQHQIDQVLTTFPASGEPLSEGIYVVEIPPLRVYYEIDAENLLVTVTNLGSR